QERQSRQQQPLRRQEGYESSHCSRTGGGCRHHLPIGCNGKEKCVKLGKKKPPDALPDGLNSNEATCYWVEILIECFPVFFPHPFQCLRRRHVACSCIHPLTPQQLKE